MANETVIALIAWLVLLVLPRWWLLAICTFVFVVVAAQHAGAEAGDMIVYALLGVVPIFTLVFLAIGILIVWGRKAIRRARAPHRN